MRRLVAGPLRKPLACQKREGRDSRKSPSPPRKESAARTFCGNSRESTLRSWVAALPNRSEPNQSGSASRQPTPATGKRRTSRAWCTRAYSHVCMPHRLTYSTSHCIVCSYVCPIGRSFPPEAYSHGWGSEPASLPPAQQLREEPLDERKKRITNQCQTGKRPMVGA